VRIPSGRFSNLRTVCKNRQGTSLFVSGFAKIHIKNFKGKVGTDAL